MRPSNSSSDGLKLENCLTTQQALERKNPTGDLNKGTTTFKGKEKEINTTINVFFN